MNEFRADSFRKRLYPGLLHVLNGMFGAFLLLFALFSPAYAEEQPFNRHILALYDSHEDPWPERTLIHEYAEVILNHLGLIVDYHDIAESLPTDDQMNKYRGIISWFQDDNMTYPSQYLKWLRKQIDSGKKAVILGNLGAYSDRLGNYLDYNEVNDALSVFGVSFLHQETDNPFVIDVVYKDAEMVEFERPLDMEITFYSRIQQDTESVKPYLVLQRTDIAESESVVVFTAPAGAVAISPYVYYLNQENYKTQWRINPFRFFKEGFQLEFAPVPDISTLNGRRIVFSHIDGDGFISASLTEQGKLCGQVVIDEILKKYYFPVSASAVIGEIVIAKDKPWIHDVEKEIIEPFRDMYKLPNIEPAAHGYTHPLHWDKQITAIVIPGYSIKISEENQNAIEDTEYESLTMEMGIIEVSAQEMFQKEIIDALEYVNTTLLDADHPPAKLMFWTGNCMPDPAALQLCEDNNIANINAGDPVFDEEYNSYTFLCAIRRCRPDVWQFYTAACNENIYTNLWSGPFYGFREVVETFKRTESPVRIKPANIYYHFYSGERHASLEALRTAYDFVIEQQYAPIFTSHYLKIARDWFETDMTVLEPNTGYRITNNGSCRTVRFDECGLFPDFSRSSGVIGYTHYQGSLYVHLDGSGTADVWLTKNSSDDHIFVHQSTATIDDFAVDGSTVTFTASGFGHIMIDLMNVEKNRSYNVTCDLFEQTYTSDNQGRLKLMFPAYPRITNAAVKVTAQNNED